jgi:hypothetical protein
VFDQRGELPLLPFGYPIGFVPASRGGVYIESIDVEGFYLFDQVGSVKTQGLGCGGAISLGVSESLYDHLSLGGVNFLVIREAVGPDPSRERIGSVCRGLVGGSFFKAAGG